MAWKYPVVHAGKKVGVGKDSWGTKLVGKMNSWGSSSVKGKK